MYFLKLQNFVAMPQTDNNEAFLFVTPALGGLILLLPERHTFLHFWRFLTDHHIWCSLAEGLPYLVIALKSTRAWPFWHFERRQPTRKIITFLISYRQPPPPKQKITEKSNSAKIFETSEKWELCTKFQISPILAKTPSILDFFFYPKTNLLSEDQKERNANGTSINIETINKLLVSKTTNTGRVHLARKPS